MSEMVERVAPAMVAEWQTGIGSWMKPDEVYWRRMAHAAIAAMRDPTSGLVEAMTDALIRGHLIEVQGSGLEAAVRKHTAERRDTYRDFVRCAWIAGIDHITQQRAAGQEAPETNG